MENMNFAEWITVIVGIYEILARVIPTSKTWSLIGKILEVLTRISDVFDKKKK